MTPQSSGPYFKFNSTRVGLKHMNNSLSGVCMSSLHYCVFSPHPPTVQRHELEELIQMLIVNECEYVSVPALCLTSHCQVCTPPHAHSCWDTLNKSSGAHTNKIYNGKSLHVSKRTRGIMQLFTKAISDCC